MVPPVMYSQQWSPTPSTTAVAPELRTAKRSPAEPAMKTSPAVAPYRQGLPARTGAPLSLAGGRRGVAFGVGGGTNDAAAAAVALAHVVVGLAHEVELDAVGEEGAEALAGRAV